ncbi:MAG: hypothetical protein JNK29_05180, partial [Anaerolineales bacterium]|nr:hypothetical protein [Anaerolineales bacterium]
MLTEIPFEHFAAQAAAFPAGPAQLALAAAAAGNSRARLWLNAGREPAGALWDQANNVVYLAGPAPAETWAALQPDIRAQALALGRPRFSLRLAEPAAGDPGWPAEAGLV